MNYKQFIIDSDQRDWEFYVKRYYDSINGIESLRKENRQESPLFKHYEKNIKDCLNRYPCLSK